MSRKKIKVHEIKDNEDVELRTKGKFPYKEIISKLFEGKAVFLADLDRRQAYYIRREIEKRVGELVEASPVYYKNMSGYEFHFSVAEKIAQKLFAEEAK